MFKLNNIKYYINKDNLFNNHLYYLNINREIIIL